MSGVCIADIIRVSYSIISSLSMLAAESVIEINQRSMKKCMKKTMTVEVNLLTFRMYKHKNQPSGSHSSTL